MKTSRFVYSLLLASQLISAASASEATTDGGTAGGEKVSAPVVPPSKGSTDTSAKCPVMSDAVRRPTEAGAFSNRDWWPNQLNLKILAQNSSLSNPMGRDFSYAEEFKKVDLAELKKDINALMTIR